MNKISQYITAVAIAAVTLVSCKAPTDVAYFQDARQDTTSIAQVRDLRIQPRDKLSIIVNSRNAEVATLFNLAIQTRQLGSTSTSTGGNQGISLYTVDSEGNIDFPVLGSVHIGGMNRQEIVAYIKNRLVSEDLCNDAVVTVEFQNLYIDVLGEVAQPGRFQLTQDRVSVLDAIGMAGDLSIQGKRANVLVVRNENDQPHSYQLDLTHLSQLTQSPAFYLKQGDVVYVEPNNYRQRQTTVNGNNVLSTSFWLSMASFLMSIAVLIVK